AKLKISSAYHPKTDGATERANRTIVQMIRQCIGSIPTEFFDLSFVDPTAPIHHPKLLAAGITTPDGTVDLNALDAYCEAMLDHFQTQLRHKHSIDNRKCERVEKRVKRKLESDQSKAIDWSLPIPTADSSTSAGSIANAQYELKDNLIVEDKHAEM
ncbi:hypothetical protein H0H81_005226, partial [Sphagnurus paluster]